MNSFNHYAFGAVGEWMYSNIAGIDLDPQRPGYKHILIRPRPEASRLTHARGKLQSVYGPIESAWRVDGETFSLDVTIPPNTTATVFVPGREVVCDGNSVDAAPIELGAGRYAFTSVLGSPAR